MKINVCEIYKVDLLNSSWMQFILEQMNTEEIILAKEEMMAKCDSKFLKITRIGAPPTYQMFLHPTDGLSYA